MTKLQAMIDIETLGTKPGSVIWQVGIVFFNKDEIKITREWNLDINTQLEAGMFYSPATAKWAKANNLDYMNAPNKVSPKIFCEEFFQFVKLYSPEYIWANDPDFDCVLLGELFSKFGFVLPWKYFSHLSFRTAKKLSNIPYNPKKAHNALADAIEQAEYIQLVLRK